MEQYIQSTLHVSAATKQCFHVPASVYSEDLTTQSDTGQELPKYQAQHNTTYQIDSLKKEMNKK